MPTAPSSGPRSYPDGQRVDNRDSAVLFTQNSVPVGGLLQTPVINVASYDYLAGYDGCVGGPVEIIVHWFSDLAGTNLVGFRHFVIDPAIANRAQFRLLNLGPFVQVSWLGISGAPVESTTIFGTNRMHPLEFMPFQPVIIQLVGVAIGIGASVNEYPSDYYAGPVFVFSKLNSGAGILSLQFEDNLGNWQVAWNTAITVATAQDFVMVTPPGAWRLQMTNTAAGASTFNLGVVPSMTGSS